MEYRMNKRTFLITSASLAAVLCAVATGLPAAADTPKELRIGYQKIGALLILKDQGLLEKRLAAQGIAVKWVQFQSGPPLIEALNAGAIDFGYTGDTPPIFAQASGVNFVYVASMPVPGKSNAILVRENSGIKTIADLRGKKIAFVKGSSAHNVVVQTLEKAHIAWSDITPVYLQPADAGAAIQSGAVDAWSIWDPFYAVAEHYPGVKLLTNAVGIAPSNAFFLATRDFATRYPRHDFGGGRRSAERLALGGEKSGQTGPSAGRRLRRRSRLGEDRGGALRLRGLLHQPRGRAPAAGHRRHLQQARPHSALDPNRGSDLDPER
jgi:sulfonate transport system substrate-binding protein